MYVSIFDMKQTLDNNNNKFSMFVTFLSHNLMKK